MCISRTGFLRKLANQWRGRFDSVRVPFKQRTDRTLPHTKRRDIRWDKKKRNRGRGRKRSSDKRERQTCPGVARRIPPQLWCHRHRASPPPPPPPPFDDEESTMRDGRLTFSLRGTSHDNNRFNSVPVTETRTPRLRPREIVWKPVPVVDFSGSPIST